MAPPTKIKPPFNAGPKFTLREESIALVVAETPAASLWEWLNRDEQFGLLRAATRGFQCTPRALRQAAVRKRLIDGLKKAPERLDSLLAIWGATAPAAADLRVLAGDATVEQLLPLRRQYGVHALLPALALEKRDDLYEWLLDAPHDEPDMPVAVAKTKEAKPKVKPPDAAVEPPSEQALNQRLERAQRALLKANAVAAQLQSALDSAQEQAKRFEREADQLRKQDENRELAATTVQEQLTRRLDRTARKLKSLEAEVEESGAQNKRLQRQLRQQQQLTEELRKQLANQPARNETEAGHRPIKPAPAVPKVSKEAAGAKAAPVSPFDQLFVWKSDGRPFRVSPREVKRAIDCNDEEFVFSLIQAFDALRETNPKGYRMFLDRIREFDRYYSRVLTADTTRVLVDASNVARHENNRYGKGKLGNLLAMRDELRRRDCFPIQLYADASLPYHIDAQESLLQMSKRGEIVITPAGQEADEEIAREARRTGAYVVTNDRNFHLKVAPDFEPPRIGFTISDGFVRVEEF